MGRGVIKCVGAGDFPIFALLPCFPSVEERERDIPVMTCFHVLWSSFILGC